ncbi:MAG: hypothetical protein ACFE95_15535 [Candidatus Hodarchaeota archaeon]
MCGGKDILTSTNDAISTSKIIPVFPCIKCLFFGSRQAVEGFSSPA